MYSVNDNESKVSNDIDEEKSIEQNSGSDNEQNQNESNKNDKACCKELQELRNRCLYLTAEFDNYKKRIAKERAHWTWEGESDVLKNVLFVLDDVERALSEIERESLPPELAVHLKGFELISKSLYKLLEKYDVQPIKNKEFDPEVHEALMQVESKDHSSGQIIEVMQKGYTLKGELLRPSKVTVAK